MASAALAPINTALIAHESGYSENQIKLISDQIMPGASQDDLMLFATVAARRGLDPFCKHIYAVSRRSKDDNGKWVDKWSYQVSIDGLRLIAQRSGRYEGQTPPQWCGPDGIWKEVWLAPEPPAAAKVGVYIKGTREPLVAIALYRTFVQTYKPQGSPEPVPTKFWADMPEHMLAKCAESQALRKAFPEEAGGLYTAEEMGQANNGYADAVDDDTGEIHRNPTPIRATVEVVNPGGSAEDPARTEAKNALWDLAHNRYGWNQETLNMVALAWGQRSLKDMDATDLQDLCKVLATESPEQRQERLDHATAAPVQAGF